MADLASTRIFGKLTVMHDAILKANAEIIGIVTAASFVGAGSGITSLNANNLASGTVPIARISSTSSRTSSSTATLLHAKAMNDHRTSGDHDSRYTQRSSNLSDLTNATTARANLGLGASATRDTATQAQALDGSDNSALATMLRVHQAFNQYGLGRAGLGDTSMAQQLESGFYRTFTDDPDSPTGNAGTWIEVARSDTSGWRLFLNASSDRMFFQRFLGDKQPWREVYHTGRHDNPNDKLDKTGNGSAITSLNASNIASGTVPIARISSTSSRTSSSTATLLHAKAMNDHRTSGDHDSRYMQPGFMGWGGTSAGGAYLSTPAELDNTFEGGFYRISGAAIGKGGDGGMLVMVGQNDTKQIAWSYTNELYFRGNDGPTDASSWGDWNEFYHTGNLSPVSTSRSISTGSGLSGGGNLSSNRSLSVDSSVVRTSGNQSMSGDKTFTGKIRSDNGVSFVGDSSDGSVYTGFHRSEGSSTQIRTAIRGQPQAVLDNTATGDYTFIVLDGAGNNVMRIRPKNSTSASALRMDQFPDNTTTSGANVYVTGQGNFYRSTSSIKYKKDVEDAEVGHYRKVLDLRPVFYRSKGTHDEDLGWGYWGFIAEEVAEIDPRLVHWDTPDAEDEWADKTPEERIAVAKPNGMQYDRVGVLLQAVVKDHDMELAALREEVASLKALVHELLQ